MWRIRPVSLVASCILALLVDVAGQGSEPGRPAAQPSVPVPGIAELIAQQAYLKASNAEAQDELGGSVAVSGDTVAVGAIGESSTAVGVDGDPSNNGASDAGAVYVFVRDGSTWSQQAYIKASNTSFADRFGTSVALSGDTLVVGAPGEDSSATGIGGNQLDNGASSAGAAYVFVRNGTTWSQQAYLKASNTAANDGFGESVAVSGDLLVVGATDEDSSATGVDGNQADNAAIESGAAYVFVRNGTTWSQQAYLKASNTDAFDSFGQSVSASGDTVVVGASGEDSRATGVDGNQANNTAPWAGAAYVFVRNGTTWSQQAYLKASNTGAGDFFGESVSISGDTIVAGAIAESSNATGVDGNQLNDITVGSGAAYVFVRAGSTWSQQAYLKASNTGVFDEFGSAVAVSGDRVVVGATKEGSSAIGVDGNQSDDSVLQSGAAYVFVRVGTTWSQLVYLKASNTGEADQFGGAVALSGSAIVAAAYPEDGSSTGVNGFPHDDGAFNSGAAYVLDLEAEDPWTDLGGGTSGSAGPPLLSLSGTLQPFSVLDLDLVDGAPSALAILFISFGSTPAAFLGGTLHAFPVDELVVAGTNGVGEIHGSVMFPGAASGQGLWFQVGIADASVPIYGACLSNGVRGIAP